MNESMRADTVATLRSRARVRPSSGRAHCDAVGAAVDQPIVCIMANAPMITRVDIEGVESGQLSPNMRQTEAGKMVAGRPAEGDIAPTAAAS